MHAKRNNGGIAILAGTVAIAIAIFSSVKVKQPPLAAASELALRQPTGQPQLVSIARLPHGSVTPDGEMCEWAPASTTITLFAELEQEKIADSSARTRSEDAGKTIEVMRPPVRTIRDTDPIYSSIAVDAHFDEVILQDENLFGLKIFNRLDNTAPGARFTEPKRVIAGPKTKLQYNCGLYVDQNSGDIYSVMADTGDRILIFSHDAKGNVSPARELMTPHRGYAVAVDEEKQELYLTVQFPPKVMVYRKMASGDEKPLRVLEGERTGLADSHGIAIDPRTKLLFVNNYGNTSNYRVAGTGKFNPPSITVYPLEADGDSAPLRVIQGPKTELDWPGAMYVDPERGDLYVANDLGDSILVFHETDEGNVAPARMIKGPKTGLKNPTGVFVDNKNKELWVSNMGNAAATVYSLMANGDVAPLRTIRSAPPDKLSIKFGKTEAVAYDSKREQILVPN